MIAQLPAPKAAEFGAWMLSLACFVVIVRQIVALMRDAKDGLREWPTPAETYQTKAAAAADRAAQTSGCTATHTALNRLLDERNSRAMEERQETRQAIAGLSDRIESVLKLLLNDSRGRGGIE